MDQLTHTVRRSNWINIIRQCQDRPAGTTAKQWLAEMNILASKVLPQLSVSSCFGVSQFCFKQPLIAPSIHCSLYHF